MKCPGRTGYSAGRGKSTMGYRPMNWTNVRAKIGALVAIAFILLMVAAFAAHRGYNIPILSNIVNGLST